MLLSLCFPTYNRSQHILRQLHFAFADAEEYIGRSIEILVSNNASSDGTDFVIQSIHLKKPYFDYTLQSSNIGPARNVEYLVRKATGKYVWVIGDDDVLRPGTIRRVMGIISDYADSDLGGIYLASIWGEQEPTDVNWDLYNNLAKGIWINNQWQNGLIQYSPSSIGEIAFQDHECAGWIFLTRSILLKNAYMLALDDSCFFSNKLMTIPLAANFLSIKDRNYYIDTLISVYGGRQITWSGAEYRVYSCDLFLCILMLKRYFSVEEHELLLDSFFNNGPCFVFLTKSYFINKKNREPAILEFAKLSFLNGCALRFLKCFYSKLYALIRNKIMRLTRILLGQFSKSNDD